MSINGIAYTLSNPDGTTTFVPGGGLSSFTLWTPATAISLYSAGGDAEALPGNAGPLGTNAVETVWVVSIRVH